MESAIPTSSPLQVLDSDKAPYSIGYRIKLLSQLLGRHFQEMLEPHDLTPFHWLVLCCLWEQDGLPTSHLGDRLCQVGGTLTGVIDRMEERGVVRRERDPQDRRVCRIWLTESGRQLEAVLPPLSAGLRERALKGLSQAERQLFSEWIDRMIANLF
jgi:MarR family transcriptional regulator, organic hydroperoxide resistance regulator